MMLIGTNIEDDLIDNSESQVSSPVVLCRPTVQGQPALGNVFVVCAILGKYGIECKSLKH